MPEKKETKTFSIRLTPEDHQRLTETVDAAKEKLGVAATGDLADILIDALAAAADVPAPESIASHVMAIESALKVVSAQTRAISSVYETIESAERAKAHDAIASQANRIAQLEEELADANKRAEELEKDLASVRDELESKEEAWASEREGLAKQLEGAQRAWDAVRGLEEAIRAGGVLTLAKDESDEA